MQRRPERFYTILSAFIRILMQQLDPIETPYRDG